MKKQNLEKIKILEEEKMQAQKLAKNQEDELMLVKATNKSFESQIEIISQVNKKQLEKNKECENSSQFLIIETKIKEIINQRKIYFVSLEL